MVPMQQFQALQEAMLQMQQQINTLQSSTEQEREERRRERKRR